MTATLFVLLHSNSVYLDVITPVHWRGPLKGVKCSTGDKSDATGGFGRPTDLFTAAEPHESCLRAATCMLCQQTHKAAFTAPKAHTVQELSDGARARG